MLVTMTIGLQRGQVDDVVDAGAERLDPAQTLGPRDHGVGQHRPEGDERLRRADHGLGLAMMRRDVHGRIGEDRAQAVAVLRRDLRRQGQEEKYPGHVLRGRGKGARLYHSRGI
jgi:hypothetical protein